MEILDWGLIDYQEALKKQEELVELVYSTSGIGAVVLCTHPPIVTLGSKTQDKDVFAWKGATAKISRGGRATYHGPSQLVVYPIIHLARLTAPRPNRDIGWYLRNLEGAIVDTLAEYGVESVGKIRESQRPAGLENTGVWVGSKKIASVGIAIRKWVTYHGAAINLDHDPEAFKGMKPCGYTAQTMTSLEKILKQKMDRKEFQKKLVVHLRERFQ